jgi:hypothetical protein
MEYPAVTRAARSATAGARIENMGRVIVAGLDGSAVTLPMGVKFPVELRLPAGFDPERVETWPL